MMIRNYVLDSYLSREVIIIFLSVEPRHLLSRPLFPSLILAVKAQQLLFAVHAIPLMEHSPSVPTFLSVERTPSPLPPSHPPALHALARVRVQQAFGAGAVMDQDV